MARIVGIRKKHAAKKDGQNSDFCGLAFIVDRSE
jgi:hypothetical protein